MVLPTHWRHGTLNLLNEHAAQAQSARHPIQRLHPELLAEIFTYCIPEEVVDGGCRPISIRDAPLLLCRVCSSWYSLTTATPRLWQRFFIASTPVFIKGQYEPVQESLPRGIRTWLGRSGALPLNIRFVLSAKKEIIVINALNALFDFSSRWNSVIIEVSPSVPWPNVGVLPNLHDFDGSFLPISEFPFASAPSLKTLQIYKLPQDPLSTSRIPWGQLTELIVNLVAPILAVLDILRGCPLLEMLTIPIGNRLADDSSSSLPLPSVLQIKHDTLRWLGLYIMSNSGAIAVEYLTLPALKGLRLCGRSGKFEAYCHPHVLNLLTRSKCNLQRLAITTLEFEPDNLLEYLKHPSCRTLTSLDICESDCGVDDVISVLDNQSLSHLTYSEEQGKAPLCPKLADLRFETCYRSDVGTAADVMGRMIQSRCFGRASDERLRSLDLVTWYPISPEDSELLQLAQDQGGLRFSYKALGDYPPDVPSDARRRRYNPGVLSDVYHVSGQDDESEDDSEYEGESEEGSDDDGSEESSDDDGSEESSDDDGNEESSDDGGSGGYNSGVPSDACHVSGQEDESKEGSEHEGESEEDSDDDRSEEGSNDDGSEEGSNDDGSEEASNDDGSEEDSNDDGSGEDSANDSVWED